MARRFTKYPSSYVKASTVADSTTAVTLLDALGAGFEQAWASVIEKEELDDSAYEDALVDFRNFVRTTDSFTEEQKHTVLAMLYELEDGYTKSMDSFANTPGYESDSAFWQALDKIRKYLEADNSIGASTSIKADSKVYKISDNPPMYTNIDFDNMYAELDKDYARYPNAKGYIDGSIKLHLEYGFITRAEANALREKYLGDN